MWSGLDGETLHMCEGISRPEPGLPDVDFFSCLAKLVGQSFDNLNLDLVL